MIEKAEIYFGSKEYKVKDYKERRNPYTQEVVSLSAICFEEDALKALKIAKDATKRAKESKLSQRIAWLEDVALKMEERKEELAKTITDEVAKPIALSIAEVERGIETIKATIFYANSLEGELYDSSMMPSGKKSISYYKREPAGVVVAITPFNFPINLVLHKLAPALLAGNCVVLKPTPEAPLCAYKLAKIFIESKHAIEDALSLVYGDAEVGGALVKSEIARVISFTGSVPVGKIITQNAGIKKISLELGGNAATFIESSADIEHAAKRCAFGAFANSGQVCISLQRIYVDSKIYDNFCSKLVEESKKLKIGSPYKDDVFMSSLINDEASNRAISWIESAKKEGAKVACGGEIKEGVFMPTVMVDVLDSMKIICEEVFAPIVSLVKVESFEEAVEKINSSPYGLQFSVFTDNLHITKRAIDELECGGIVINDIPTLRFDIQPYGGVKYSGIGREGPKFALEEFSEIKSVVIL